MSGPKETHDVEINLAPLASARIAYTLDNYQPVKSSFIGTEPFFFMDSDEIIEEDTLFEDFSLEMFAEELEGLHHKMESYESISKEFHQEDDTILDLFAENADFIADTSPQTSTLESLKETLITSRFADTLLDYAHNHGVELEYSSHVKFSEYDRDAGKIYVHPSLDFGYQILMTAAELRRVWQHKNGALVDPMAFYPDHGILINRLQEADAHAFMVRIAWELKLAHQNEAWALIENSSLMDLGRAFAQETCTDFRAANNGKALLNIVEAWFLSDRCRQYDRTLIQRMLAGKAPEGFAHSQDLSRQALIDVIYALGKNPYGNNYLAPHIQLLIEDPIFSEVRDRSNANFLWFVKFESSFAQAEQELQMEESLEDTSSHTQDNINTQLEGQKSYEAEIIPFPKTYSKKRTSAQQGAILPFSRRE